MKDWYCSIDNQAYGPYSENILRELIDRGQLTVDTYVYNDSPEDAPKGWQRAGDTEITALFLNNPQETQSLPPIQNQGPTRVSTEAPKENAENRRHRLSDEGEAQTFSSNNAYEPGRRQFEEKKPKFRYALYVVGVLIFVGIAAGLLLLSNGAGNGWKTETYARITFKLDSSWEKKHLGYEHNMYYPPNSESEVIIDCGWIETSNGYLSDEEAKIKLLGVMFDVMESAENAKEISRAYLKIGDQHAARLSYYCKGYDDERWRRDAVVVLFKDGFSVLSSSFPVTKYESYKDITETTLSSVELAPWDGLSVRNDLSHLKSCSFLYFADFDKWPDSNVGAEFDRYFDELLFVPGAEKYGLAFRTVRIGKENKHLIGLDLGAGRAARLVDTNTKMELAQLADAYAARYLLLDERGNLYSGGQFIMMIMD
jgi:hypothetical protein